MNETFIAEALIEEFTDIEQVNEFLNSVIKVELYMPNGRFIDTGNYRTLNIRKHFVDLKITDESIFLIYTTIEKSVIRSKVFKKYL